MKPLYLFATILLATLAAACNGGGEGDGKKTDRQIWAHEKPLVAMVEVSSGGSVIETYEYTYDEQGRILTLVKTDKLAREVVLDLNYSYPAENEMKVQGKFFPIATNRYIDVSYNPTSGTLSYKGSWSGAFTLTPGHGYVYYSKATQSSTLTF